MKSSVAASLPLFPSSRAGQCMSSFCIVMLTTDSQLMCSGLGTGALEHPNSVFTISLFMQTTRNCRAPPLIAQTVRTRMDQAPIKMVLILHVALPRISQTPGSNSTTPQATDSFGQCIQKHSEVRERDHIPMGSHFPSCLRKQGVPVFITRHYGEGGATPVRSSGRWKQKGRAF